MLIWYDKYDLEHIWTDLVVSCACSYFPHKVSLWGFLGQWPSAFHSSHSLALCTVCVMVSSSECSGDNTHKRHSAQAQSASCLWDEAQFGSNRGCFNVPTWQLQCWKPRLHYSHFVSVQSTLLHPSAGTFGFGKVIAVKCMPVRHQHDPADDHWQSV